MNCRKQASASCSPTMMQDEEPLIRKHVMPVRIVADHVSYFVKKRIPGPPFMRLCRKAKEIQLLRSVSFSVNPGELWALMGPSGAGKSTLLDLLAGRKNSGRSCGQVLYDGLPPSRKFYTCMTGYVMQDDLLSAYLTVQETLEFAAALRIRGRVSSAARKAMVDRIIERLELHECRNTRVGSQTVRGISGGQKKRLSVGIELLASPSVLFLDEPTSGLDASIALGLCKLLRNVADDGTSLVATIHQPSSDVIALFDCVCLLRPGGGLIYAGPLSRAAETLGLNPPPGANIAEVLLDFASSSRGAAEAPHLQPPSHASLLKAPSHGGRGSTAARSGTGGDGGTAVVALTPSAVDEALGAPQHASPTEIELASGVSGGTVPRSSADGGGGRSVRFGGDDAHTTSTPGITSGVAHSGGGSASAVDVPHAAPNARMAARLSLASSGGGSGAAATAAAATAVAIPSDLIVSSASFDRARCALRDHLAESAVYPRTVWHQFAWVASREAKELVRNSAALRADVVKTLFASLIMGLLFYKSPRDSYAGVYNRFSVVFFAVFFNCMASLQAIPLLVNQRALMYRERVAGTYATAPWYWGITAVHAPKAIGLSIVFSAILYWMVGMRPDAIAFVFFTLMVATINFIGLSWAQFLAASCPDSATAMAVFPSSLLVFIVFAGFVIRIPDMPSGIAWLADVSFLRWGYESLIVNEFYDTRWPPPFNCAGMIETLERVLTYPPNVQYAVQRVEDMVCAVGNATATAVGGGASAVMSSHAGSLAAGPVTSAPPPPPVAAACDAFVNETVTRGIHIFANQSANTTVDTCSHVQLGTISWRQILAPYGFVQTLAFRWETLGIQLAIVVVIRALTMLALVLLDHRVT